MPSIFHSPHSPRAHAFQPLARAAALALLLCGGAAMAADKPPGAASAPHCDGVQQDRAACLREAGAARQEAQRGGLSTPGATTAQANALARCQNQPAADRADCEARVRGTGASSTSGSVMGGGVIRETVTPLPPPAR